MHVSTFDSLFVFGLVGGRSLKLGDGLLINVEALADLLGRYHKKHPSSLKAVVFNACSSASHANALCRHGVPSIGVESKMRDSDAHLFSINFFSSMFDENYYDVPKASDEGKYSLAFVAKDNDPDLSQYRLYMPIASEVPAVGSPSPPVVPGDKLSELVRRVLKDSDKPLDKLQIRRAISDSRRPSANEVNKELLAMESERAWFSAQVRRFSRRILYGSWVLKTRRLLGCQQ